MLKAALTQANTSIALMLVRHSTLCQKECSCVNTGWGCVCVCAGGGWAEWGDEAGKLYLLLITLLFIPQKPWLKTCPVSSEDILISLC